MKEFTCWTREKGDKRFVLTKVSFDTVEEALDWFYINKIEVRHDNLWIE